MAPRVNYIPKLRTYVDNTNTDMRQTQIQSQMSWVLKFCIKVIKELGNHTTHPKGTGSQKCECHHGFLCNLESIRPKGTSHTKLDSLMDKGVGSKAHKREKKHDNWQVIRKACTGFSSISLIKLYRNPLNFPPLSSLQQSSIQTDLNESWSLSLSLKIYAKFWCRTKNWRTKEDQDWTKKRHFKGKGSIDFLQGRGTMPITWKQRREKGEERNYLLFVYFWLRFLRGLSSPLSLPPPPFALLHSLQWWSQPNVWFLWCMAEYLHLREPNLLSPKEGNI